jgi:hypothetical protein
MSQRWRVALLWAFLALFVLRVVGQLEVLLLAPAFLPPFAAWESGLIPYALLLPVQILLIGWMSVIADQHTRGSGFFWVTKSRTRRRLRLFAALYAGAMLVRLAVTALRPPHTLLERGLIPITAHWVLASFIALLALAPAHRRGPGHAGSPLVLTS